MERWRWYAARSRQGLFDGQPAGLHAQGGTRTAAGLDHARRDRQADMATPLLSETMKYITVNPTWNVPPSIVHNEYLPALAQDPTVLSRMGLKVVTQPRRQRAHLRSRRARPTRSAASASTSPTASWSTSTTRPTSILFAHDVRAYSHGCMRVQDPAKYAEVLLQHRAPDRGLDGGQHQEDVRHRRDDIQLQPTPIRVHMTYQSAFVDDAGKLQIRRDVYGLDSRMIAAIKSEERAGRPAEGAGEAELRAAVGAPALRRHRRLRQFRSVVLRRAVRRRPAAAAGGAPGCPHRHHGTAAPAAAHVSALSAPEIAVQRPFPDRGEGAAIFGLGGWRRPRAWSSAQFPITPRINVRMGRATP